MDIFHFRPSKLQRLGLTNLTFTDEDLNGLEFSYDDPLVITALIGNHNVHKILVDTGATFNLMYYSVFKATGLTKGHLTSLPATLVGLSGERTMSLGTIKLSMTLGTTPKQVTIMAYFLVLGKTPNYNVILGKETLNEIMRFPPATWL